jgi:hypothetical protein
MPITRIVSGGQTGADRGGLEAALYCDMPYGGWVPKGRRALDGVIPAKYEGLQETSSASYEARTEANVVDSDATLVFTYGKMTAGSKLTFELANKHKKPVLHIAIDQYSRKEVVNFVKRWFDGDITEPTPPKSCVLNVAGSRESKAPGIQEQVMAIIIDVISAVNGKLFYPLTESKPMILRDEK